MSQLFAVQRDAVAYLSQAEKEAAYDFAQRELGAKLGPAIYQMDYDTWLAECHRIEGILAEAVPITQDAEFGATYNAADTAAFNRLDELLPISLCKPDGTAVPHELYLEARTIAVNAGLVR